MPGEVDASCICGSVDLRTTALHGYSFGRQYRIVACARCSLRFPHPLPSDDELASLYTNYGEYSDAARVESDIVRQAAPAGRLIRKIEQIVGSATGRFLEVGCANGALLSNVARQSAMDCYGVEVDPASANAARALMPGRIMNGSLEAAAFDSGTFRVVYAAQVIEHVRDSARFVREIHRIMTPGGVLFTSTPNFGGLSFRLMGAKWKEFAPDEHIRMFTRSSLGNLLRILGFQQVEVQTRGFSFKSRPGGRDHFPFSRSALMVRVVDRALAPLGVGDGLFATARR